MRSLSLIDLYRDLCNPFCRIEDLEKYMNLIFSPKPWFIVETPKEEIRV